MITLVVGGWGHWGSWGRVIVMGVVRDSNVMQKGCTVRKQCLRKK